ncbi:MAG: hypothetical protein JSV19_04320 [Phycisphaerales bacterium]|nr:MAG: hypothetical protein JSV19_04320 [Phycisphaerales bacterium]
MSRKGVSVDRAGTSRVRPWVWLGVVCLGTSLCVFVADTLGPLLGVSPCIVWLLVLFLPPVLLACVGGYYRNWWVSLGGVLGTLLAVAIGYSTSMYAPQVPGTPRLILPSGLMPFLFVLGIVMLPAAIVAHAIVAYAITKVRVATRFSPGHCQSCGHNLTGNTSGICPECGEPTAKRSSSGSD